MEILREEPSFPEGRARVLEGLRGVSRVRFEPEMGRKVDCGSVDAISRSESGEGSNEFGILREDVHSSVARFSNDETKY